MKTKSGLNLLTAISAFLFSISLIALSSATASGKADKETILMAYGRLPLCFIENKGQLDSRVRYYVKGSDHSLYFTNEGIVFDFVRPEKTALKGGERTKRDGRLLGERKERLVFNLGFENPREGVLIEGWGRQEGEINFYTGNDRSQWKTAVPVYEGILYKGVYEGIDLKVFGNEKGLEYEFIVNPGGNPDDILLTYNGIEGLTKNEEGALLIGTAFGQLKETEPYIYQEIEGKIIVEGSFEIRKVADRSQTGKFSYGFQIASYDSSYPLIIDPVLSYSTYLGGSAADDIGMGVAVDGSGYAYVVGYTYSGNFPTQSPFQGTFAGVSDVFITKFAQSGSVPSFSTYFGGSSWDVGTGIAVDASGNAYVTGYTYSSNFPTTQSAYQGTLSGGSDAFIAKFTSTGSRSYATYLGGSDDDFGNGIAVDASGNAYVTGSTSSNDFPTKNAFQGGFAGSSEDPFFGSGDAFITQISPTGTTLQYSTYLGGSNSDVGKGIAVDASGNAYVTGYTSSSNFPTTPSPYQGTLRGASDAFITKVAAGGTTLQYSTYLGGTDSDSGNSIAVDTSGNAHVTGYTYSTNFPTLNAVQLALRGSSDAFITKVAAAGKPLQYSTYLGGSGSDSGNGIAVDALGKAYVTGTTASTNFPTKDPYQATLGGSTDAFIAKLTSAGTAFYYATYLGGTNSDDATGIVVDSSGNTYVTGTTASTNFPTKNAYQAAFAGGTGDPFTGNSDAFVTKVSAVNLPPCDQCYGDPVVLTGVTFPAGTECECTAATSIDIGPNVTIENGATVNFKAPKINVKPKVDIKPGAVVNMTQ